MTESDDSDNNATSSPLFRNTRALGTAPVASDDFGKALLYLARWWAQRRGRRWDVDDIAHEACLRFYQEFCDVEKEPNHRRGAIFLYVKKVINSVIPEAVKQDNLRAQFSGDIILPHSQRPLTELEKATGEAVAKLIRQSLNRLGPAATNLLQKKIEQRTFAEIQQQYSRHGVIVTEGAFRMRYQRNKNRLFALLMSNEALPPRVKQRLEAAVGGAAR